MSLNITNTTAKTQTIKPLSQQQQKKIETNWFSDWLNDKDKVCTDDKDDGSLSVAECAESFGKGLIGLVKSVINHPVASLVTIGIGAGLTVLTGGAFAPALVALGVATGAGMIGYGAYNAITADNDADAKNAWETMGNGTFALASSVLGSKSALKTAGNSGVKSALGSKGMSYTEATIQCFKSTPESLKVSGSNIINNSKIYLGLAKPKTLSQSETFELEKRAIENKFYREMESTSKNTYYDNVARRQHAMQAINEDNIEIAKKLYDLDIGGRKSDYIVFKERYCKYYQETIPKILNSNNPEVQQLALDILADDEIIFKAEALDLITPKNTSFIREQLYVGMPKPEDFNSCTITSHLTPAPITPETVGISYSCTSSGSWEGEYIIRNGNGQPVLRVPTNKPCDVYQFRKEYDFTEFYKLQNQSELENFAQIEREIQGLSQSTTPEIQQTLRQQLEQIKEIKAMRQKYPIENLKTLQERAFWKLKQEINSFKIPEQNTMYNTYNNNTGTAMNFENFTQNPEYTKLIDRLSIEF